MKKRIDHITEGASILILGYGKEGKSTARYLHQFYPECTITIADRNVGLHKEKEAIAADRFILGNSYLDCLEDFDLVIKSPGIPLKIVKEKVDPRKITSQTEIFLEMFRDQTIGVTGTKGKSTTSSLIHFMLGKAGKEVFLLGNIGVPPLDLASQIDDASIIIFEMSSHQLDGIVVSPKIAVFLNIFEEHLDHYKTMEDYRNAKYNIFKYQSNDDWLISNDEDLDLKHDLDALGICSNRLGFSIAPIDNSCAYILSNDTIRVNWEGGQHEFDFSPRKAIPGQHNLKNIMAAICVGKMFGVETQTIESSVIEFKGLSHRLEYIGKNAGIHFYNDSIATIPEATIEAVKTFGRVHTLILGGKDRGIDYSALLEFLTPDHVNTILLVGEVGERLKKRWDAMTNTQIAVVFIEKFGDLKTVIPDVTPKDGICLLSPAASSYDMFTNFEERGRVFKKIAENI